MCPIPLWLASNGLCPNISRHTQTVCMDISGELCKAKRCIVSSIVNLEWEALRIKLFMMQLHCISNISSVAEKLKYIHVIRKTNKFSAS